jgi:tetratricopeptide (TPR) repeat protein
MKTFGSVIAAIMLVSQMGIAEEKDPATADALFRAGREAADHGDSATACARFGESYRLDPAVGTLLNLADCEVALERLAEAWEHYRRVADALDPNDERAAFVTARLGSLSPRLPKLLLSVRSGSPPSTEVVRDGVRMTQASFGLALPVNPGRHELIVTASEHAARRYALVLAEGETARVTVEAGDLEKKPPAATKIPRRPNRASFSGRRTAAFLTLGAAGASLIATGLLAWRYTAENARISDHCPTHQTCDEDGLRAVGAAQLAQIGTLVAASTAVVTAGVGLTLLWTEPAPGVRNVSRWPSGVAWQTAF